MMWRFFLGLPVDGWSLLLRCVGWAIVPPGINGSRFPWSHCLLRAGVAGPVLWWLMREHTPGRGGIVMDSFAAACLTAVFCLVTLTLSALTADFLRRPCE